MNGSRSMSGGHNSAWASPRLSSQAEQSPNEELHPELVVSSPNSSTTKRKKHFKPKIKRLRHPTESFLILKFFQFVTVFVLNVLFFSLCLVFICTILPIVLLVRKLVISCCVRYNSRYGKLREVVPLDGLWFHQALKVNTSTMSSIFFLMEGSITTEEIRDFIADKWLYYCSNDKHFRFPKLREFAVEICSGFAWKQTENFRTEDHILLSTDKSKLFLDAFHEIEDSTHSEQRSSITGANRLWKVTIFPKFLDSEDSGLLLQMHQSVADIFSFSRLTLESLGYKTVYLRDRCFPMQRMCIYLSTAFAGPLMVIRRLLFSRPKTILDGNSMLQAVCGSRTVLWSEAVDFKSVKRIKDITRTKVDIVLMSCLAGAVRSYLFQCGEEYPGDVRACLQTDIRPQHAKLELDNLSTTTFVNLPSGTEGAVPRLWEMRRRVDTFSSVIERYAMHGFLRLSLLIFPLSFVRRLVDFILSKASCTVTYISGPKSPVYLNGKMAKLMTFWTPRRNRTGIALSLVSHANQIRLGVVVQQQLPCDPKLLLLEFEKEVEDLATHLSHRTLPSHLRWRARQQLDGEEKDGNDVNEEPV